MGTKQNGEEPSEDVGQAARSLKSHFVCERFACQAFNMKYIRSEKMVIYTKEKIRLDLTNPLTKSQDERN